MAGKKEGTVRLQQLIKASGQPEEVTLWSKPEDDPQFMRAAQQGRVLTVIQRNVGTRKDFGTVGFFPKGKAAFWIFPKPLEPAPETKVVGIDYGRLASSKLRGALHQPSRKRRLPGIPLKNAGSKQSADGTRPATEASKSTFRSTIQLTAIQKVDVEVQAPSAKKAAPLLKRRADELVIDSEKAKVSRKVGKPKKVGASAKRDAK
jgi:hypothetical protein